VGGVIKEEGQYNGWSQGKGYYIRGPRIEERDPNDVKSNNSEGRDYVPIIWKGRALKMREGFSEGPG